MLNCRVRFKLLVVKLKMEICYLWWGCYVTVNIEACTIHGSYRLCASNILHMLLYRSDLRWLHTEQTITVPLCLLFMQIEMHVVPLPGNLLAVSYCHATASLPVKVSESSFSSARTPLSCDETTMKAVEAKWGEKKKTLKKIKNVYPGWIDLACNLIKSTLLFQSTAEFFCKH